MELQLKNDYIKAMIQTKGAELISLKKINDNTEYIWNASPAYWKRHAPVLFPIVGKVVNNEYRVYDKTYHLNQHGFARDMEFEVIDHSEVEVTFGLKWNEETLLIYPYKFEFFITYTLKKNKIKIEYQVNNVDNQAIYFSVGAHPGFNVPLKEGESFEDYYFEFEKNETASITLINSDGLFDREKVPYLNNEKVIKLNESLFKENALVFDHLESRSISLKSLKSSYSVRVDFEGFSFLGLWSLESGAPFVCIEPWIGHADYFDFTGDFSKKEDQIKLEESDEFKKSYSIAVE